MQKNLLISGALIALLIIVLFNSLQLTALASLANEKTAIAKENSRPGKIQLIELIVPCSDCIGIDSLLVDLKKQNLEVVSEKRLASNLPEAQNLIKEFGLTRLPALIVFGETTKQNQVKSFFEKNGFKLNDLNQAVFETKKVPYFDLKNNSVRGRVSVVSLTAKDCSNCSSFATLLPLLRNRGIVFDEEKFLEFNSSEGKDFVQKHGLQKVPAIFLSENIQEYPEVFNALINQLGFKQGKGYIFREPLSAPFVDALSGETKGLVKAIFLDDSSCNDCYDVNMHKQIFDRFKLFLNEEETVEVSSEKGQQLISDYNISRIPTVLLSPEAKEYQELVNVWRAVGTIEENDWFVFREPSALSGVYIDLNLNLIVNPILVLGAEFEFQPSTISVKKGQLVKITFVNVGQAEHDFVINELNIKTKLLKPQESETIEFIADKTGEFSFYCSVEGHKEQGMKGTIIISK